MTVRTPLLKLASILLVSTLPGICSERRKRAIATLGHVAVLGLLFLFFLLFALDCQHPIGKLKADVLGIEAMAVRL